MATIPPKKFTLRAFRIANPNLTESNSGILRLLEQVLTPVSTAAQRRMPLNVVILIENYWQIIYGQQIIHFCLVQILRYNSC